jgi:DNA-directed RNA polymerase subunit D
MDIAFTPVSERSAKFVLSHSSPAYANSIRRAMIGEVPTLAIEEVRIYDNTSVLFDEMLAHRLGLIPLRTDLTLYVPQSACACEGAGCPACTATYTLSAEGPRIVYSRDLIPQDPRSAPAEDNVPIAELKADQKIVLEARAVINTGKVHGKWQATTVCGYKNYPILTIDENCDGCASCVDECPRGVLKKESPRRISVVKIEDCSLCRLCEKACLQGSIGTESAIRVSADETRFIFVVESDGSLPVMEITQRAVDHLGKKAREVIRILDETFGGVPNEQEMV